MSYGSCDGHHGSRRFLFPFLLVPVLIVLSACGGSSDSSAPDPETPPDSDDEGDSSASYLVSGTVSGMADQGIVLVLNDDESLEVGGVSFSFDTEVASGAAYEVIITDSPQDHQCSVRNGTGTMAESDVTDVQVICRSWQEAAPVPRAGYADSSSVGSSWGNGRIYSAVDTEGNAVVFWWESAGGLWASRYLVGSGWESPVQLGEDAFPGHGVNAMQAPNPVVIDAEGNATVLWRQDHITRAKRYVKGVGWRETEDVLGGSGNGFPAVAGDGAGNILSTWSASSGNQVWAYYDAASGQWQTAPLEGFSAGYIFLHDLVADPGNPGEFLMVSNARGNLYARRFIPPSGWETQVLVASRVELSSLSPATRMFNPTLAMSDDGRGIVAWASLGEVDPTERGVWVSHYDPAEGWSERESVGPMGESRVHHPQVVMDSEGRAMLTWRIWDGGLWAASHVSGRGWSEPERIGTADTNSFLVLDADERVHTIFTDGASVKTRRFSHEAGWEETRTLYSAEAEEGVSNGFPTISFAADGSAFATWLKRTPDGAGSENTEYYYMRLE